MPFHIRDASPDDVPALARLHVQTFNETHRGGRSGGPSYELRERQWRGGVSPTGGRGVFFLLADDPGRLRGLAEGTPPDAGGAGVAGARAQSSLPRRLPPP